MNDTSNTERQPSVESQRSFPLVGDVVIAKNHFPRGIVLSSNYPDDISAAAIKVNEDGTEKLGIPGTIRAAEIQSIEGRWDIDRITEAWANTCKAMGGEMSPEEKIKFRKLLLARAAIHSAEE